MPDDRYQENEPERKKSRRPRDDDDDSDVDIRRHSTDLGDNAGIRMLLPVGRSAWAIAAGYLGLFSLLCLPGPLALFCGIMAVREMRRDPSKHGMGRAVFGIVLGGLGTAFLLLAAFSGIMAAITG